MNQTQRFKVLEKEDLLNIGLLRHSDNEPFYEKVVKKNIGYNKTCPSKMKGILELYDEDLDFINKFDINTYQDFIVFCLAKPRYNKLDDMSSWLSLCSVSNKLTKLNNNGTIRRIDHTSRGKIRSFEDLVCLVTTYFPEVHYLDIFKFLTYNRFYIYNKEAYSENVPRYTNFSCCYDIRRVTCYISWNAMVNIKIDKFKIVHESSNVKANSVYSTLEMTNMIGLNYRDEIEVTYTDMSTFYQDRLLKKLKPYEDFTKEELSEIIKRINPSNVEYLQFIKTFEDADNYLMFLPHYEIAEIEAEGYKIRNYKDLIHVFFMKHYKSTYGFSNYDTHGIVLNSSLEKLNRRLCCSSMRSFEDILILTLTYFPETSYLEVFEVLLQMVIDKGDNAYSYIDFFFCEDIERINCLTRQDDYKDKRYDFNEFLNIVLNNKIEYLKHRSELFDEYLEDYGHISSLKRWSDLYGEYLCFRNVERHEIKQVVISPETLKK